MAKVKRIGNKKGWQGYGKIAGVNVNDRATLEAVWQSLRKFNIYLSYDLAVPVLRLN